MAKKKELKVEGKLRNQITHIYNNYEFRFNVVLGKYEYKKLRGPLGRPLASASTKWEEYGDRVKNDILCEMMLGDLEIPESKFNIYVESNTTSPDYDPFQVYFDNLKDWDEKTNYIEQIANTVKTDNQELFIRTITKFLVGTVACLLDEKAVNDYCLVFQGPQGIGKNRWMQKLIPSKFSKDFFKEGYIDPKNKDHILYLSQFWFIHLDELESLKGKNVGDIKSYITTPAISERSAYGRYKNSYIRRASFLGSVNEDKFLVDTTGNRRWLVFMTSYMDYMHHVDIDGVWSQALYLYNQGFKYWFNKEEVDEINDRNEQFREMSLEEELVLENFEFPESEPDYTDNEKLYVSASHACELLSDGKGSLGSKLSSQRMGRALAKHSKLRSIINGVTKYYIHKDNGVEANKTAPVHAFNNERKREETKTYLEEDELPF